MAISFGPWGRNILQVDEGASSLAFAGQRIAPTVSGGPGVIGPSNEPPLIPGMNTTQQAYNAAQQGKPPVVQTPSLNTYGNYPILGPTNEGYTLDQIYKEWANPWTAGYNYFAQNYPGNPYVNTYGGNAGTPKIAGYYLAPNGRYYPIDTSKLNASGNNWGGGGGGNNGGGRDTAAWRAFFGQVMWNI